MRKERRKVADFGASVLGRQLYDSGDGHAPIGAPAPQTLGRLRGTPCRLPGSKTTHSRVSTTWPAPEVIAREIVEDLTAALAEVECRRSGTRSRRGRLLTRRRISTRTLPEYTCTGIVAVWTP